jgi:hypothetical protein
MNGEDDWVNAWEAAQEPDDPAQDVDPRSLYTDLISESPEETKHMMSAGSRGASFSIPPDAANILHEISNLGDDAQTV